MEGAVLIAGNQSPLKQSLARACLNHDTRVLLTWERSDEEQDLSDVSSEQLTLLEYSSRSFLATRTLFLECKTMAVDIQHIIILHSILNQSDVLQGFQSNVIEQRIDEGMKGFLFFLRESILYLEKRKTGSLNIILHNDGPKIPGPMEALVMGGIESLGTSLFTYYGLEGYSLRGYSSREQNCTEYAEYILNSIFEEQASGKWYHYRNRSKLFQFGRN